MDENPVAFELHYGLLLPVRLSDDILITRISDQNRTSFRAALRLVRKP